MNVYPRRSVKNFVSDLSGYQTERSVVMKVDEKYEKFSSEHAAKSPLGKDCFFAFTVGGFICVLGQAFSDIYTLLGVNEETVKALVPVSLIFLSVLLTGIGVFDKIAKFAGAGTLVPITGFANAVAAPAIDNKAEGYVMGLGAKIFIIAGPVIMYGILASVIYGGIYYIAGLIPI